MDYIIKMIHHFTNIPMDYLKNFNKSNILSLFDYVHLKDDLSDEQKEKLMMLHDFVKEFSKLKLENKDKICSPLDAYVYLKNIYQFKKQEYFLAMYLDTKNHVVMIKELFKGGLNRAVVDPREVFQTAMMIGGIESIILVHNHPSYSSTPSYQDISLTEKFIVIGNIVGIQVLDHIIISSSGYCSILEEIGIDHQLVISKYHKELGLGG